MVANGMWKAWRLQYVSGLGKSMINVRRKYAESKAYICLKYGKSIVKYSKSTVLVWKLFLVTDTVTDVQELYAV